MNLGYLAAVVVLGGIILFHEFGHYLLARLNGIAVVEFSVGFGPRLLSWVSQKTGIRYSLKLLPLGGSCAMLGEFGEDEDEKEEVPDVKGVSFFDKGPLAKMAVIAAGPLFNFILAFVFSLVILSWAGIDPAVIAGTSEGMPAETAGLKEGDVITKLDGRKIHLSREISMYLMTAGQDPVQVEYRRYDETSSSWTTEHTVIQPEFKDGRYYLGVILQGHRLRGAVLDPHGDRQPEDDRRGQGLHKRYRRTCPHCHDHRSDCGREHPVRIRDGCDEPLKSYGHVFGEPGRYEPAPVPGA